MKVVVEAQPVDGINNIINRVHVQRRINGGGWAVISMNALNEPIVTDGPFSDVGS